MKHVESKYRWQEQAVIKVTQKAKIVLYGRAEENKACHSPMTPRLQCQKKSLTQRQRRNVKSFKRCGFASLREAFFLSQGSLSTECYKAGLPRSKATFGNHRHESRISSCN